MFLVNDIRVAVRRLRRNPLFAATVIGTLAIGVGATSSIYSIVDGVLLKPLPFANPETLVRVTSDYKAINLRDAGLSQPELAAYAGRFDVFDAIAGIWPINANLTGSDRPERVEVLLASANYFDLLGVRAALGRTFNERDEIPGIATVAVISDGLWRRGFGADPAVLGRSLRIDEDVYEIVGVMPPAFRHPSVTLETDVEVWAPAGWKEAPFPPPSNSARFIPSAIGRLKSGVTPQEAGARIDALARTLTREYPDDYPARLGFTPVIRPLAAHLVDGVRPALLLLMGGIVFVLLIAISNVSNLLLVRSVEREREIAVQRALGASRLRVASMLLVEGAVLAVVGGGLGFVACLWGVDWVIRLAPDRLPRLADVQVDYRVFLFAVLTSAIAGVLVALAPVVQSARTEIVEQLKVAGRALPGGPKAKVRSALVVAQVAIAILLLAGAGLLVRSLRNLQRVDTGMQTENVVTARLWLPQPNDPAAGPYFEHGSRAALIRAIVNRVGALPGVTVAAMCTALPAMDDSGSGPFAAEGWTPDRKDLAIATAVAVTPGYFRALGVRLMAGRLLQDSDDQRSSRAVVVNETLAKSYFAGEEPVGRRIRFVGRRGQVPSGVPWMTIVGVVRDVKEDRIDGPVRPQIYQSLWQTSSLSLAIVARGATRAPGADAVRASVKEADSNLPVYAIRDGESLIAAQLAQRRFATLLINAFAASALFLSAFGLHGLLAYGVRQRTHEIGLRIALGATALTVVTLVLGQAVRLALVGVAIGLAGALALGHLISTMLFGVSVRDPWTLGGVVVALLAVAGVSTIAAARRAARIEPAIALREG
ncbi:MAG TPA: ABC transporter permease [Vicinamibacterales bacterium]|nr:ABC transporter permease [Vicinamibacterales bacterium]